jgi:hypothetical protein
MVNAPKVTTTLGALVLLVTLATDAKNRYTQMKTTKTTLFPTILTSERMTLNSIVANWIAKTVVNVPRVPRIYPTWMAQSITWLT